MAKKKIIDEVISNLDQDWSGITDGTEWGYRKGRIEEVIKRYLKGHDTFKFGSIHVSTDESSLTTVRFFANDDAVEQWEENPEEHADLVLKYISIQGSAEAQEYTLVAKVVTAPKLVQIAGEENIFRFSYNSYWGTDISDLDARPGTAVVFVNNVEVTRIETEAGGNEYSINIGQYIFDEANTIKIVVSNSHGKSRTWEYLIEAKSLSVRFADSYIANQDIAKQANWELPVFVSGVGGTVHVSVDNGELEYEHNIAGGSQYSFRIDPNGLFTRGTHHIEVWAEDNIFGLSSNHIYTSYIVAGDSINVAVGANAPTSITLYENKQIPYYVYSPNDEEGTELPITVEIRNSSDVVISTKQQSVIIGANHSSGLQNTVVQIVSDEYINENVTVKIIVGNNVANISHNIQVLSADIILHEAAECKVHYKLDNKTNTDSDVVSNNMESTYNGVRTSRFKRSDNFVLKNDVGFVNGGFVIPANKKATLLDWQPFASDFGVAGNKQGKTIEMEFSIGIAANVNTPVISCIDNKCGFEVYPTRIEVKYETSAERIITYFPDETRIKFSLVINGTTTECVNDDGNGNREVSYRNLAFLYVNGVMVRIFDYGVSTWNQQSIKNIVFGSDECNLTLYSIRGYDKALSMKEVLDNFSFDTPVLEDKIAIAKRNNILESDGTTVSKVLLETALPNTPIINWWVERLPSNKKDPRECKQTDFVNPEWSNSDGKVRASFTASSHEINGDGTSSNAYPLPYKNWAEKYKDYNGGSQPIINLHLTEGDELVKKYSISYGIEQGETKFVHKVNFASSEGIFNILAMNMYHTITLNAYNQIADLLSLQQQAQVDAGEDVTFRKSLSGFPEIGFRTYTENGQVVTKFLSIYNFINNKKTGSMFGMEEDYKINQLWEVDENVNFFNTLMTEHSVDGQGNVVYSNGVRENSPFYYSRVPADSSVNGGDLGLPENAQQVNQANDEIKALRKIHNWIVSVNPNVAKRYFARYGEYRRFTIQDDGFESITYGNLTFTRDTPAYRAQKFIAEYEDNLHLNDCIFYFIFCTYIVGIDSMDKNMSLFLDTVEDFYSDDAEVRENAKVKLRIMLRDTDSIALFSNSGVLTFKYWHEWNDTYNPATGETGQITGESYDSQTGSYNITTNVPGTSPVFNGRLSGLWDAIVNSVPSTISSVYGVMRNSGLNATTFMQLYKTFYAYWCEALYNVDGLGYANTGKFDMAYGDKLMNTQYFFKYRERYMDSKYGYIVDARQVTLRLSSVPLGIWMKHSTPIYASFSYGGNVPTVARSIVPGEPAYLPCYASSFNDATCYINDADLVTEIGTYVQNSDESYTLKGFEGIQNFHFTFNFNRLVRLQKFIWANTDDRPNTEQTTTNGTIDFSNLKQLKELVMTYCTSWNGSPIIGSEVIEKIDFRGTPITSIKIPETETLTEVHLPGTITELRIHNCPNLTTLTIDDVAQIRVIDIDGCPNINVLNIVDQIYNLHLTQEVALEELHLHGIHIDDDENLDALMWITELPTDDLTGYITLDYSINLTWLQKEKLINKFGNIDDLDNPLHINYHYEINDDLPVYIVCNGIADTIPAIGDYQFRCIPMVNGVFDNTANYISKVEWAIEDNPYAIMDSNGVLHITSLGTEVAKPTATITMTVTLIDGVIRTATFVLGMYHREIALGDYVYCDGSYSANLYSQKTLVGVVYIDEDDIKEIIKPQRIGLTYYQWGLYSSGGISGVTIDGSTPAYNILKVKDINGVLVVKDTNSNFFKKDTDEFAPLTNLTNFKYTPVETESIDIGDETIVFEVDKHYSLGYYNTQAIIEWRNKVLEYAGLPLPEEDDEFNSLTSLIRQVISNNNNQDAYQGYYYPSASYCFAYEPVIKEYEVLDNRFKKHRWFLPCAGELARIFFYYTRNDDTGKSKYDAFKGKTGIFNITNVPTSSESSGDCTSYIYGDALRATPGTSSDATPKNHRSWAYYNGILPACLL